MPDVPLWYGRLDEAIRDLESLPFPWVDCNELQAALGVGRRRAQQILHPLVSRRIGRNGLAAREDVIRHLERLASGQVGETELRRRQRFAELLTVLRKQASQPKVLVQAPTKVQSQGLSDLPSGIELAPGRIVIAGFQSPDEARQRLLALILAMGNEPDVFDELITAPDDR